MEENKDLLEFCAQLVRINGAMAELFQSGNVALFGEINAAVKALHAVQHESSDPVLQAVSEECKIIYVNSDMIVEVLRTTEDGVIDTGAQKALNKFLHNIDDAVVNIAKALDLV